MCSSTILLLPLWIWSLLSALFSKGDHLFYGFQHHNFNSVLVSQVIPPWFYESVFVFLSQKIMSILNQGWVKTKSFSPVWICQPFLFTVKGTLGQFISQHFCFYLGRFHLSSQLLGWKLLKLFPVSTLAALSPLLHSEDSMVLWKYRSDYSPLHPSFKIRALTGQWWLQMPIVQASQEAVVGGSLSFTISLPV